MKTMAVTPGQPGLANGCTWRISPGNHDKQQIAQRGIGGFASLSSYHVGVKSNLKREKIMLNLFCKFNFNHPLRFILGSRSNTWYRVACDISCPTTPAPKISLMADADERHSLPHQLNYNRRIIESIRLNSFNKSIIIVTLNKIY